MNSVLSAMIAYVLAQFAVGAWVSRHIASEHDYILAGRRLGTGLITFSVFATYFGAEAIVASGGAVYAKGLAGARIDPFGYAAAIVVVGLFFAKALWSRGLTTFADLFRQRFSPGVERLVVLVLAPGSIIWAAAQVRAFGQLLSANSSLSLGVSIGIAAGLVGGYAVVGGLLADAVTDVIQGIVVMGGLLILATIVIMRAGGLQAGLAHVDAERLRFFEPQESVLAVVEQLAIPICGTIVAVELISRLLGARSAHVAVTGTLAGGAIYLCVGLLSVLLGLLGATSSLDVADPEQFVSRLAAIHMPGALYSVFVGAIISAILSSVHAALHAPAAQISHNILVRLAPGLNDRGKLWAARGTVLVLSIVAFLIAASSDGIAELVETASSFGSAGVFVVTLFALFSRSGGPASAYASVLAGALVWAAGKYVLGLQLPYLSGLAAATIAYAAAAWFAPRRD
jgi:Na+/proline symporter